MNEEDECIYIKCRDEYSSDVMFAFLIHLLEKLNLKFKKFEYYRIAEITVDDSYLMYFSILDMEKSDKNFRTMKFSIEENEILELIRQNKSEEEMYRYIFGDLLKGI